MKFQYNIQYISTLCSEITFKYIHENSTDKSGQAIQKFHRLLIHGLANNELVGKIETLSSLPVAPTSHKKMFWKFSNEQIKGVLFRYIPIINIPIIKNFIVLIYAFIKVLRGATSKPQKKVLIYDVLSLSNTLGAFFAAKIRGFTSIAIVTDMPGIDVMKKTFLGKLKTRFISFFISQFDGYIFMTEPMNTIINTKKKPYIIMEGLVDNSMDKSNNELSNKEDVKILIYSGGIYERYGIKKLIEAFKCLNDKDIRLHIYGAGPMEKDMPQYMKLDNRIRYCGVVENSILVKAQQRAMLLINPRPSNEELTKYSFPSKNMEYMVSGTPTLTTPLPGMPKEYYPFVFLVEEENIEGLSKVLRKIVDMPKEELHLFGDKAKEFVLNNKNNIIQGNRVVNLINDCLN